MTFPIAVLNPRGRDPYQRFTDGAGVPGAGPHAPVNYHAFAACTGGAFHQRDEALRPEEKHVLLLLKRDLKECRQAMVECRRARKTVVVAFKEAGAFQVADLLRSHKRLKLVRELCTRADAALATTPELEPLFASLGARDVEYIPTPYPVEDVRWQLGAPSEERYGIFIGTREFDVLSRNHLTALLTIRRIAESMGEPVTVINTRGWRDRGLLSSLRYPAELLNVVEGPLSYAAYLRLMGRHKIVFQLDASVVPGQVAGDALLTRTPCLGGNGAVERLVWPSFCGWGRTPDDLLDLAAPLLDHGYDRDAAVEDAVRLAHRHLSFTAGAEKIRGLFHRLDRS